MSALSYRKRGSEIRPFIDNSRESSTVPARNPRSVHGRITTWHLHADTVVIGRIVVTRLEFERQRPGTGRSLQTSALKDICVSGSFLSTENDYSGHQALRLTVCCYPRFESSGLTALDSESAF